MLETSEERSEPILRAGEPTTSSKWIIDNAQATKTCETCGAVMRGWAFREPFIYCPMCGVRNA